MAQMDQMEATGTAATETDTTWLQALEEKVHAAAGLIRELREENATLRRRVGELEDRLTSASASDAGARWTEEREEIRGRIERLVEHLEGLL